MYLPNEIIVIIFSYLTLEELSSCETVCKDWYALLLSSNAANLYSKLNLQKRNIVISNEWLVKKLSAHRPKLINFSGTCINTKSLISILQKTSGYLEYLDISFHVLCQNNYLSLSLYTLKSLTANDCKLKDNCLKTILELPSLSYLNINYNSTLTGKPFYSTDKELEALWFEGCEHIEFPYIYSYVKNHGKGLKELGIDGEYFSCEEVCNLLALAPELSKFAIEYANEMNQRIGEFLVKPDWEHLKVRRATGVTRSCFVEIFSLQLWKLVNLNLAECISVDDLVCVLISTNCIFIKQFTLTWCSNVTDLGISKIVSQCTLLQFLDLTGLKDITDLSFPLSRLDTYRNLRTLILEKCNRITDIHLWNLSDQYIHMKIKNYYGEFKEGWTGVK